MSKNGLQLAATAGALASDPREAARMARLAGSAGLLFDAHSPGLNIPELSSSGRREFRHILSTQDQQLVGLHVGLDATGLGLGADVDRVLARLERVMEAAAGLQAPLVPVDLGRLPGPPRQPSPTPRVTPEQAGLIIVPAMTAAPEPQATPQPAARAADPALIAQVDGALAELGRRADRYGVILALRSDLSSFAALERALKQANCPWFGVDLDPVAILRDEWSLDEVLSRLAALVRHVRARDAVRGADRRTRPAVIGQGDTDWEQTLAALDDAGYRGWLTVDSTELTDRVGAAVAGLQYLRGAR